MIGVLFAVGAPAIYSQLEAGRPPKGLGEAQQIGYGGEVVYYIHAGKAGRIYGETGGTTNSLTLVAMPDVMKVTFKTMTAVYVELKLCIELAIAGEAEGPAGLMAYMDNNYMYPSVGGTTYMTGYVVHPNLAAVGSFSGLESWCFDWEASVSAGTHTISFKWAVAYDTNTVWGDYFAISVWATRVRPA